VIDPWHSKKEGGYCTKETAPVTKPFNKTHWALRNDENLRHVFMTLTPAVALKHKRHSLL